MAELTGATIDGSNPAALVTSLLAGRMSERARRLLTAYVLGTAGWRLAKQARHKYLTQTSFAVSITGADDIYPDVQEWLLDLIPEHKRRSLAARTQRSAWRYATLRSSDDVPGQPIEGAPSAPLFLAYDGSVDQVVTIGGQRVSVSVSSPERPGKNADPEEYMAWMRGEERIRFTARNLEGREAVVAFLGRIAEARHSTERIPNFHLASPWGDWYRRNDLPLRDPATVKLPGDQMQRLIDDVEEFRLAEPAYNRLGIPYHRGYLLHGPPGTGKTSIARAIATHFGMDVYYLPLSDLTKDSKLLQLMSGPVPGSMLLLEDIDVLHATRDREADADSGDEKDRVSLSGLLNALDGIASPHGLLTVMTTNHLDRLDPALIRSGRVDVSEHIGHLTHDQLVDLFTMTFPGPAPAFDHFPEPSSLTPAEAVGIIKANLGNDVTAYAELTEYVQRAGLVASGSCAVEQSGSSLGS